MGNVCNTLVNLFNMTMDGILGEEAEYEDFYDDESLSSCDFEWKDTKEEELGEQPE